MLEAGTKAHVTSARTEHLGHLVYDRAHTIERALYTA